VRGADLGPFLDERLVPIAERVAAGDRLPYEDGVVVATGCTAMRPISTSTAT
jgi:hypothetical protein